MFINAGARLLCTSARDLSWGLCLVLVCRGRHGLGGAALVFILGSNLGGVGPGRGLRGKVEGVGVRSRPGVARTILLFHTISVRPPEQPH